MKTLQSILFDLDDTLYPERDFVFSGFKCVAEWAESHLGIPARRGFAELRTLFAHGVRGNTFDLWLAANRISDQDLVPLLVEVYRNHNPKLKLFPDTLSTLKALHKKYLLGIVSDGLCSVQKRKIDSLGIGSFFTVIILSDGQDPTMSKPSPQPFERALTILGAVPDTAVYVADNPAKDYLGARRAGMWSIRIQRPGCEHSLAEPPTSSHAPDATISSLHDLMGALETIELLRAQRY